MTMDVGVLVKLGDKLTGPLRGVVSAVTASSKRMSDSFAKASSGMRQIGGGLGGVVHQTRGVIGALAAYKGAMAGVALSFVGPAAQMERFRVQLTSLEGGSAGAEKALAWISDFATRTPLEMTDTIAAYAKLKAFGIDPTNGSLQSMVDTMAAMGGGVEQLDGLVMALGQAWSKGKLQSEEALQLLERGVPVWDLLANKMGKSSEEVQKLASEGKLGRDEISMLMAALGEKNAGAGDGMAKTRGGILSNLSDYWTRFQLMVMENGVFDSLKAKLQSFLDLLNQMAADGRLQQWADMLATNMLAAIEGIWSFGKAMLETWRAVFPWLEAGATAMGGWDNFLGLIAAGALAPKIIGVGRALLQVGKGLLMIGRLAMANPIIATIAIIAAGAVLIYRNWGAI
jgi:tape measure domain-containing protein